MDKPNRAIKILEEKPTGQGYIIRRENWDDHAGGELEMTTCYTNAGYWIGDEDTAKFLCEEKGIKPENRHPEVKPGDLIPCSIGFCEKDKKWYGWSHRAVYGFGIGSEVKKGDCAYTPTDMEDARLDAIRFWSDENHIDVTASETVDDDGRPCFDVSWKISDKVPNEKRRGQISGCRHYPPEQFGNGEWTAQTLDDARQMACDFAEGVG